MNAPLDFKQFEVLTFDCYGTLIDWETGILTAVRKALATHGVKASDKDILEKYAALEAAIESGPYVSYRIVLARVMEGLGKHFRVNFSPAENDSLADSIKDWLPFPDTVASLQRLASRYKLAIISNIDSDLFRESARHLDVEFSYIVTAQQIAAYKPFNFELAVMKIGQPKDKVLHVAESIYHDIIPAKALGWKTVWLYRRMGKEGFGATKAAEGKPDLILPDLKSLADLVLQADREKSSQRD
ncbi:MAG TPA: haloacid dehalogenase type II [Terriglobales bacterium]|nr:haloacid dehalogenase type II [Terriglobales bacterium]